jgi:outer membrane protein assembly factor BamB
MRNSRDFTELYRAIAATAGKLAPPPGRLHNQSNTGALAKWRSCALLNRTFMTRLFALPLLVASPLTSAEPENFDRLTYHAPPKALSADAVTEDWPRFLGPRHDLHSRETQLIKPFPGAGLKMVWEVERGAGHAPPVISGDRLVMIHAMADREVIECLHPETGRRHWKFDYPVKLGSNYGTMEAPRSGPVIDGDLVFTVGVKSDLHCLDLKTGKLVWKTNLDTAYGPAPLFFGRGSCPLVHGDQLIVNVGGKFCVGGFEKRTGKLLWSTGHDWHASYASPVPASIHGEDRVLVFAGGMTDPPTGGLLSIDPKDGTVHGEFPWRVPDVHLGQCGLAGRGRQRRIRHRELHRGRCDD